MTLSSRESQIDAFVLVANDDIRRYILELCEKNNYRPLLTTDLEELVEKTKRMQCTIVFIDYQLVNTYGTRLYSRINVACPDCSVILLCDQAHRDLIKEAMEHGVYACILSPFEEWEVLTMIRNILAKKKPQVRKKSKKRQ
jgi:DNA-binding NtrC family response regulator